MGILSIDVSLIRTLKSRDFCINESLKSSKYPEIIESGKNSKFCSFSSEIQSQKNPIPKL